MSMSEMLVAVQAALANAPCRATAISAMGPIGDVLTCIGESESPMIVVLVGADVTAIDRAMLLAAIGPLAIARAPEGRIGALDIAATASEAAVAAAARFLADAESTTGQILSIA